MICSQFPPVLKHEKGNFHVAYVYEDQGSLLLYSIRVSLLFLVAIAVTSNVGNSLSPAI